MSGASIGQLLVHGRKKKGDAANPTDPVWAHSYDVEDPRASPGRKVGDGTPEFGWAFSEALIATAKRLHQDQYDNDYDGPHRLQRSAIAVLEAILQFLDFKTGQLTVPYEVIAEKARVSVSTAKQMVPALEYWGLLAHVRRSEAAERSEGAGPRRKQASNAYFFDCRRKMAASLWQRFWGRIMFNLKRIGRACERRASAFRSTFNEVAKPAPRPTAGGDLGGILERIRRDHFPDVVLPWEAPECKKATVPGAEV